MCRMNAQENEQMFTEAVDTIREFKNANQTLQDLINMSELNLKRKTQDQGGNPPAGEPIEESKEEENYRVNVGPVPLNDGSIFTG